MVVLLAMLAIAVALLATSGKLRPDASDAESVASPSVPPVAMDARRAIRARSCSHQHPATPNLDWLSSDDASGDASAPTVIFVVMDTVRADRTSLCGYGRPTTPTLERLAELGASYACNSHSPSTWTLPSHASFMTGRDLDEHHAGGGGSQPLNWGSVTPLGARLPTLAEEMSGRGYQTLLLSGNPVVEERMGLTRGFDHLRSAEDFSEMHDCRLAAHLEHMLDHADLDSDRPLFAFINIADPHSPWTEIPAGMGFVPPREGLVAEPDAKRYESGRMDEIEAAQWLAHLSDVYDFALWRADRSLALVLDVLRTQGWLDRGYRLVITSDHGEYLGEHQLIEHGRPHFYEPVTRVPLLYLSSENRTKLASDAPAIVAHALARDGAVPNPMPPRRASAFRSKSRVSAPFPPCSHSTAALWAGTSKLSANRGQVLRFDLNADPEELRPLAAGDDPSAAALLDYCRKLDDAYVSRDAPDAELTAQLQAQLRALGYLEAEPQGRSSELPSELR